MRLYSLAYTEYEKEQFAWTLEDLSLIDINLIVGRNATGKSRVLRIVAGLARLIQGRIQPSSIASGNYRAVFIDDAKSTSDPVPAATYTVSIFDRKVTKEVLEFHGVKRLERGKGGRGSIWFEKVPQFIDVSVPEEQLASASRRDPQQHRFLEALHEWAASVWYYETEQTDPHAAAAFQGKIPFEAVQNDSLQTQVHLIIRAGKERFGQQFVAAVRSDMRRIGYDIEDFGLMPANSINSPVPIPGVPQFVFVQEAGIAKKLNQIEISSGMFRALATLIFLHFIRLQKKRACFLIDDIGEGLDFERATGLISILIQRAEEGYVQLLLTSNDRFVMNNVPLKYWSVIQRDSGKVKVFNPRNSPDRFAEFEEYGFNNFDFFAKGFFEHSVATSSS